MSTGVSFENALDAGRGRTAGLLDQPGNGIRLVNQPQTTVLITVTQVARIHVDAAAREHTMRFGDHRRDPAHVEVDTPRALTPARQSSTYMRMGSSQCRWFDALIANSRVFAGTRTAWPVSMK